MNSSSRPVTAAVIVACAVLAGACASSNAVPRPFPTASVAPVPPGKDTGSPAGDAFADTALSLQGTPYRNGGADPAGFDCSGFVEYVFARHGVRLPRTVKQQFTVGRKVRPRDLQPGDLVFFDTGSSPASHVGVMVGGDRFVHAPSSKGTVRVEHLGALYWSQRFVGARRVGDS